MNGMKFVDDGMGCFVVFTEESGRLLCLSLRYWARRLFERRSKKAGKAALALAKSIRQRIGEEVGMGFRTFERRLDHAERRLILDAVQRYEEHTRISHRILDDMLSACYRAHGIY